MLPVLRPGPPPSSAPNWRTGPPDFVGVGVLKAGATWSYSLVAAHPSVVSAPKTELHSSGTWREPCGAQEVDRYHSYFPRRQAGIRGEWTPRYISDFWAPPLRGSAAARAKILVRDLVQRYASGLTVSIGDEFPFYVCLVLGEAKAMDTHDYLPTVEALSFTGCSR
jgi:hypothetical protein